MANATQQRYSVGTKLKSPFGGEVTVTDPNQFFSSGYTPITAETKPLAPTGTIAPVTNPVSFAPTGAGGALVQQNIPKPPPAPTPTPTPTPPAPTPPEEKKQPKETIENYVNRLSQGATSGESVTTSEQLRATLQAMLPKMPEAVSSAEEFKKLRTEQGVVKDEEELAAIRNEARLAEQELRQFRSTAGQKVTEAGRLGAISEAERNLTFRMEGLALQERAAIERVNLKNSYINTAIQLGTSDYNTAFQRYNTEFSNNLKIIDLYNSRLDQEKKDALTSFSTITNLMKEQQVDFDTLTPDVKTQLESLSLKAGFPKELFSSAFKDLPVDKKVVTQAVDRVGGGKDLYFFSYDENGLKAPELLRTFTLPGRVIGGGGGGGGAGVSGQITATGEIDTTKLSPTAQAIISGTYSLNDLTPTEKIKIAHELVAAGYTPTKLAESAKTQIATYDTVDNLIDKILAFNIDGKLEGVGFATGPIGALSSKIFGTGSEEAKSVRALIGNVRATIAKERGGTTFTEQEQKLLNSYNPTINENSAVVLNKLSLLKDFIARKRADTIAAGAIKSVQQTIPPKKADFRSKYKY